MIDIELLYFDGCPSYMHAWTMLAEVLVDTGIDASVRLRDIATLSEAEKHGFAGSPTLRIAGRELEGYQGPVVLACRRYESNEGKGWPSVDQLRTALLAVEQTAA